MKMKMRKKNRKKLSLLFSILTDWYIEENILDEIPSFTPLPWRGFSEEEFISSIAKCNNSSASGPDKLS